MLPLHEEGSTCQGAPWQPASCTAASLLLQKPSQEHPVPAHTQQHCHLGFGHEGHVGGPLSSWRPETLIVFLFTSPEGGNMKHLHRAAHHKMGHLLLVLDLPLAQDLERCETKRSINPLLVGILHHLTATCRQHYPLCSLVKTTQCS